MAWVALVISVLVLVGNVLLLMQIRKDEARITELEQRKRR